MGSNLVLVIEDHLLQRMNTAEILREAGYDVIEATDAAVMPIASEDGADGRLSGAAVQMPKVRDGVDLALLIRRTYPHIQVILSSSVFGRADCAGHVRFTSKPLNKGRIGLGYHERRDAQRLVH